MTLRITIADVAKKAEVSKSTVSQFLNGRFEYMGIKTRTRIEKAIKELDYQPNVVARSLKKKTTSTIGIIVANILHEFSTQVIRAIENVCHKNGISTIICNADDNPEKERIYIETLLAKQVDGLIVVPIRRNSDIYEKLVDENFPIVFLDRLVEGLPIDTVLLDNETASRIAVNHLIENGYERISIVTTSIIENITPRVERINGYKKALESNGLPIHLDYIKAMDITQLGEGINEIFSLREPPDAIISGNDLTLMEILKYTFENNIEIGKDVGLITIDEVSFSQIHNPPLTTVAQPTFQMGKETATILLNKINNKVDNQHSFIHRYKPTLIVRNSTQKEGVTNE
ncbi:substrate-binding domain-containing protein [Aquibacillus sp. 3ASR75-11]|uniref:Substrate-binding domain-containing protein n=1 Tax=Terrihalobacillus insolitus TaxID=2950438 RepID=A0A9X3WQZ1_9BACI|nr:substrate-binding domain-containing protein [Terrihalobacillus insolitus]MDC3412054.1 substrate-binding domain-containing protein [Terrihalobacillus insolitus]MDC3423253.1 substrate-binding domain-containing protein [Terrihalobacillus insolitus]